MKRTATFAVLVAAGLGTTALAQSPPSEHVSPPPQTPGQLNSMAAKQPAKPEKMKPLSAAAQATPDATVHKKRHAAESKPKATSDEQKPKDR
jgi:hypothetical protein